MRSGRQILYRRFPGNIFANRQSEFGLRQLKLIGRHDLFKINGLAPYIRNLDANNRLTRYRGQNAKPDTTHGQRQVICQRDNAADLDSRCRLIFKQSDDRTRQNLNHPSLNAKVQ